VREDETEEEDQGKDECQEVCSQRPEGKPMMISKTLRRIATVSLALLAVLMFFVAPAFAETECSGCKPWWHVTSLSRPSYLQAGQATDEVQEVRLSSDEGIYRLTEPGNPAGSALISAEAGAGEVQRQLEEAYGAGTVKVARAPGPAGGKAYRITFVGGLEDQLVPLLEAATVEGAQVTVSEVTRGRPDGVIVVSATNLGDSNVNPALESVTLTDKLPAGVQLLAIEGTVNENKASAWGGEAAKLECSRVSLSCAYTGKAPAGEKFPESYPSSLAPYESVQVRIAVKLTGAQAGAVSEANVTGGGAPAASARQALTVGSTPTPFGVSTYEMSPEEPGGAADAQAGSHPFQLTTTLALNQTLEAKPIALAKDLHFKLPAGLIGNPQPFPRCTLAQFLTTTGAGVQCPVQTAVGVARITIGAIQAGQRGQAIDGSDEVLPVVQPLFNLEPEAGEPARFGFVVVTPVEAVPVILDTVVRTGSDYGVTVSVRNITESAAFLGSEVTFWGVPGDARHNKSRGTGCIEAELKATDNGGFPGEEGCAASVTNSPPPLLSMPTSCTGPLQTSMEAASWAQPGVFQSLGSTEPLPAMDGCNRLPFTPSLTVTPDSTQASKPSGLSVDVHIPQDLQLNASGLAESEVKNINVALPEGLALNPSAADGLQACSLAQIGFEKTNPTSGADEFSDAGASCPDAAKIATATIHSPLLPAPLTGFVYLAAPQNFAGLPENPFSSLVAMYLVAEDKEAGVLVKLPGSVSLSASGQVVATFANNPQLPFEDAELSFFGGERAPLATPARCGSYTTNASYTPWSGNEPVAAQASFAITSGPNGSACPGQSLPFSPSLASGTTNNNAGGFSDLTTTLSRPDGNQPLQSVTLHYPAGVSGLLSGVELCPEPQANAGSCGPNSQIGETIVSVGVGGDPFTVTGGKAYITGPYEGAPFGLSIVNPAKAGPFDLQEGRPVVVRAKIEVDPTTAALTITTNTAAEGHTIPSLIEGFSLQIQHVNVLINRPGFTFNPTSCAPTKVTGQINSAEGGSSPVEVPFQAANCANLKFAPKFAVSTQGKTSKAAGASLAVKLTYPKAPFGSQANIKQVKVDLPKQLPSRLTTLQKACVAKVFDANPAACPAASIVGHAKAVTPLIPVPLEGPAYFVSNGGEAFPNLIVVLQGYGVALHLVGDTFISRAGITSSTFKTVPDAPVGSFELTLPEGKYSALAANGNLCASKLSMPTEFVGQNGAKISESTPISVTGCSSSVSISGHSVNGPNVTLSVSVPVAGKLAATGKGLSKASKLTKARETVTLKLHATKGGKFSTKVKVLFTPAAGKDRKKQTTGIKLTFKK
jgi:hypothetical protein